MPWNQASSLCHNLLVCSITLRTWREIPFFLIPDFYFVARDGAIVVKRCCPTDFEISINILGSYWVWLYGNSRVYLLQNGREWTPSMNIVCLCSKVVGITESQWYTNNKGQRIRTILALSIYPIPRRWALKMVLQSVRVDSRSSSYLVVGWQRSKLNCHCAAIWLQRQVNWSGHLSRLSPNPCLTCSWWRISRPAKAVITVYTCNYLGIKCQRKRCRSKCWKIYQALSSLNKIRI